MKYLQKFNESEIETIMKCLDEVKSISYILEDEGFKVFIFKSTNRVGLINIALYTTEFWTDKWVTDPNSKWGRVCLRQSPIEAANNAISWNKEAYEEYLDRLIDILKENCYNYSIDIWISKPPYNNYTYLYNGFKIQSLRFSKGKYSRSSTISFQKNYLENE